MDTLSIRAAVARAARAWLAQDQAEVAEGAGIARYTLIVAEQGQRLSEKTWARLCAYYARHGLLISAEGGGAVTRRGSAEAPSALP